MNEVQAKAEIKSDEGLRLKKYQDQFGNWTIGFGHLMIPYEIRTMDSITNEQAEEIFNTDFHNALNSSLHLFKNFDSFTDPRQRAIVNMMFQLGEYKLSKFVNMLAAIREDNWSKAALHCLDSKYAKQCPERAKRVAKMLRG